MSRQEDVDGSEVTILLVDPDPSIAVVFREFFQGFFDGQKHTMLQAASATEALDYLGTCSVDLVISDLRLAHYSGLSLLVRARAVPYDVPIIIMTAFTELMSEEEWKMLGATEFISKPPDMERLRETITRILGDLQRSAVRESC